MNADSQKERTDVSLEELKQQLRALSTVAPPRELKRELLAAIPHRSVGPAAPWHAGWWRGPTGWAGLAATIMVLCGGIWLRTATKPSVRLSADVNASPGRVLAADYNSVRPPDINALDSNGLR